MRDSANDLVQAARLSYAEELHFTAHIRSPAIRVAFATVPRERFVGAGPWRIRSPMGIASDRRHQRARSPRRHCQGAGMARAREYQHHTNL